MLPSFKYRAIKTRFTFFAGILMSLTMVSASANEDIIKSPADQREYRSLELASGLKVMLVSDETADVSAAALDVFVGSGHDPIDRQGLAHYLEHMLFLGTEKYPKASEYQQYISEHGGSNNAYTVLNHTNYFFNIAPDHFEGALDRFAQFFIAPLFNKENVKQERANVDSEYKARKDDEGRRLWKARRLIYNPKHPSTKFSVGSQQTLADRDADPIREDLIAFYQRYYHASRMALVVISSDSLDQLEVWVRDKFAAVRKQGKAYSPFAEPLILAKDLPTRLTLKPLKDRRSLTFSFPIESVHGKRLKPHAYLSNLLGHEGEGSLLAELKRLGWANGLSAGLGYSDEVQATFDINISLSEQGSQQVDEIGRLLFKTIALIRKQGVNQPYYDEVKSLAALDFRFQEKASEAGLVQSLASMLHRFSAQDVLSKPYLFGEYDALGIMQVLSRLHPNNLQLIISDPALESKQTTDWYDVEYVVDNIQPAWLEKWNTANIASLSQTASQTAGGQVLHLPKPNPFIPQNVELIENASERDKPIKLENTGNVAVWHQTELAFKQPKAELYFSLRSNSANASARAAMLTELYVTAVEEALNTYAYPASLAGLSFRIYRHSRGLSVRISGYSDKQHHLLDEIIETMKTLNIDEPQYAQYYENTRRGLENALKAGASDVAINGAYDVLLTSSWSTKEKLSAMQNLALVDLNAHKSALLAKPDLLVLSIGNVSEADSLRAGKSVARLLSAKAPKTKVARAKIRKLGEGKWLTKHSPSEHDDAAVILLFQGEQSSIKERAYMQLLGALIHPPYYQSLRTEAGVGYIVSAFAFNLQDAPALGFSVQSNSHSVNDIVDLSQGFLQDYAKVLQDLPDEAFESSKTGLISKIKQEDKQLSDVASRYWTELDRAAHGFDSKDQLAQAIEGISKTRLLDYFKQQVLSDKSTALLSYSFGKQDQALEFEDSHDEQAVGSLVDFRLANSRFF